MDKTANIFLGGHDIASDLLGSSMKYFIEIVIECKKITGGSYSHGPRCAISRALES
jgi:hypothetical protein